VGFRELVELKNQMGFNVDGCGRVENAVSFYYFKPACLHGGKGLKMTSSGAVPLHSEAVPAEAFSVLLAPVVQNLMLLSTG